VEVQDRHQLAVLGIALVANDGRFASSVLAKVVDLIRQSPLVELVDYELGTR